MLTHSQIWAAIDALAARDGLTPSGLARKAGLDPTTFNRSKRQNAEGQLRWPSTESIAKVLAATETSVDSFLHLIAPGEPTVQRIPFRTLSGSAAGWFTEDGKVATDGWDEIAFPNASDRDLFALEIRGERFAPIFRDGDTLIIAPNAEARRGDRVFVVDTAGFAGIEVLERRTATHVNFQTLHGENLPPRPTETIHILARIVWASQ